MERAMKLKESLRYKVTKESSCGTILKGDTIVKSRGILLNCTVGGFLLEGEWENMDFEAEMDAEAERKSWEAAMETLKAKGEELGFVEDK
jgi:hypothetical protein